MTVPHQHVLPALVALLLAADDALAESGLGPILVENWGSFQKNADESNQWRYLPRVFVSYRFANGWVFTQRVDVPMLYTDEAGPGNPGGGYSAGIGNALLEGIFTTPAVAPNLTLAGSLRLVFPSPKQSPFGSSQYQIAAGAGFSYRLSSTRSEVIAHPFLRYFWGFDAQVPGTTLVRKLDLYPGVTLRLEDRWSLAFYHENPITYNSNTGAWFVPLDMLLMRQVSKDWELAFGGAFRLGNPASPSYDFIINGRVSRVF